MSYDASIQITHKGESTLLYGKYLGGLAAMNTASFVRDFLDGKEINSQGEFDEGGEDWADDHVDLDLDNQIVIFRLWDLSENNDSGSPLWTQFDQCNWESIPTESKDAAAAWISAQAKGETIDHEVAKELMNTQIKMKIQDIARLFEVVL